MTNNTIEQIYQDNLNFISQIPSLYNQIVNCDISHIKPFVDNDNINLKINEQKLYPDDSLNAIQNQVDTFIKSPSSFFKLPSSSSGSIKYDYHHVKYFEKLEQSAPYYKNENEYFTNYHHNLDTLPFLVMMGIGTGQHIVELVNKMDIRHLFIVDEDFCMLKVSMHIMDWRPIFKYFNQDGYYIDISINKDPLLVTNAILNETCIKKPYLNYYTPYYIHYNSPFFQEVKSLYENNKDYHELGWGFYDDEIMSLNHTISNLDTIPTIPIYKGGIKLPKNSTVFIVASGPSLDNDIEYIRKYKDNVIIFSAGTGLSSLLANGITPDFHIEKERIQGKVRGVDKLGLKGDDLDKITFLGISVIHPDVFSRFKKKCMFFRSNDCGGAIVPDTFAKLSHCMPTATNAALSIASHMQFEQVYLFGTDVGYWEEKNHHSKSSAYYDKNSPEHFNFKHPTTTKKIKANFKDAEILTNDGMFWCKNEMQNCISDYSMNSEITYYNCSDGGYINNSIPLKANNIKISPPDKKELLDSINRNFTIDSDNLDKIIKVNLIKEKNTLYNIIDYIIENLKKEVKTFSEMFDIIGLCYNEISKLQEENLKKTIIAFPLLRGSLFVFFSVIYSYSLAGKNKNESIEYINSSFKLIIEFLMLVKKEFKTLLDSK